MPEMNVVVREPVLDAQQSIKGYSLAWQQAEIDACRFAAESPLQLVRLLSDVINDEDVDWRFGDQKLFLEAAPALILSDDLHALPAESIVLGVNAGECNDAPILAALKALRDRGFGVSICGFRGLEPDKALLSVATHVELSFSKADFAVQATQFDLIKNLPVIKIAGNISSWQDYDACVLLGFDFMAGPFQAISRPSMPGKGSKGLNTSQVLVVQLLEMIRKNADVRQIEPVLKNDPVISYKLLRYINSAGFGLGCEIESLRHAIQVLGYTPLYRWLSVLLATAGASKSAQLLMRTALIRGRFAELLGETFLPKSELDNLFVAGLFSLLDQLLGISMAEVLDKIQLPEAMSQALLAREGIYGDFLALAEACERGNGCAGRLAATLQLDAEQVSQKHLLAIAWANNLEL
ncbi:MAG: HDOD domain-containing protein [Pseudomonadota bacterium]